ncbi:MAG: hypothetical protein KAX49_13375 [Halanaerobiales bacterium]|nr:hypothetical protein [Halanaerobiales bacterium]
MPHRDKLKVTYPPLGDKTYELNSENVTSPIKYVSCNPEKKMKISEKIDK